MHRLKTNKPLRHLRIDRKSCMIFITEINCDEDRPFEEMLCF